MKLLSLIVVVFTCLVGCSTLMEDSKNISNQKYAYQKILVVAKTNNELMRRNFEENVVNEFKPFGVTAISSAVYGLKVDDKLDSSEVDVLKNDLLKDGFDGVIITGLIDKRIETEVIPGQPYPAYYRSFRGFYRVYPVTLWTPDTVISTTKHILQSAFYKIDMDDDNLQWLGQFKIDPRFEKSANKQYPKELVTALVTESISTPISETK